MAEMDQDAIDVLLSGGGDETTEASPDEATPEGEVDQAGIDALLDNAPAVETEPPADGALEQDNIDDIFDNPSTEEAIPAEGENSSPDEMDALLAEFGSSTMGQEEMGPDIDSLLTEIQPDPSSTSAPATQENIESLLDTVEDTSGLVTEEPVKEQSVNSNFLLDMKLVLTFEVGRSEMLIGDLLSLGQGSVIELHRLVGEDLDMLVHGRLIAKGEVVVVNEKFGVRILDIITPEDRVKKMAGLDSLV